MFKLSELYSKKPVATFPNYQIGTMVFIVCGRKMVVNAMTLVPVFSSLKKLKTKRKNFWNKPERYVIII